MGRSLSMRALRACVAVVVAATSLVGFSVLGGIVVGESSVSAAQYQYGKVALCHVAGPNGKRVTITVAAPAVPAHLQHGDTRGPCPS